MRYYVNAAAPSNKTYSDVIRRDWLCSFFTVSSMVYSLCLGPEEKTEKTQGTAGGKKESRKRGCLLQEFGHNLLEVHAQVVKLLLLLLHLPQSFQYAGKEMGIHKATTTIETATTFEGFVE